MQRIAPRLFEYASAKTRLLPHILRNIPPHDLYVEPFFGSGAVFFNKPPSKYEVINDKNDLIVLVCRVLQDYSKFRKLYRMLCYTLHSDAEYRRAAEIILNREKYSDVELAYAVCVRVEMHYFHSFSFKEKNARLALKRKHASWFNTGGYKEVLPFLFERLQGAQITCRDGIELMKATDKESAFFFVDPPYFQTDTRLCAKGEDIKETAGEDFHRNLLSVAKSMKAKIMIASYPNDLYETELSDWNKLYIEKPATTKFLAGRGKIAQRKVIEALYMNYEPPSSDLTKRPDDLSGGGFRTLGR